MARAATELAVSASTLRRWSDSGRIRSVRTRGGHRRFPLGEVRRLSAVLTGTASGVLRDAPDPSHPLPQLAELLDVKGDRLLARAAGLLYEAQLTGWFAAPAAAGELHAWMRSLGSAVRFANWEEAARATGQLILEAQRAAASLVERHGFLKCFGALCVQALEHAEVEHQVVISARRLFAKLVRLTLTVPAAE